MSDPQSNVRLALVACVRGIAHSANIPSLKSLIADYVYNVCNIIPKTTIGFAFPDTEWLQMHGTSPLTRNAMRASDLTPNRALRQAIGEERGKSNVPASLAAARGAQNDNNIAPIVGAGVVAAAGAAAAADAEDSVEPLRMSIALSAALGDADAEGGVEVLAMTSIAQSPHVVGARVPSDIVLAIDISGSMNSQVFLATWASYAQIHKRLGLMNPVN